MGHALGGGAEIVHISEESTLMLPILEFETLSDYIDHLHQRELKTTRLAIGVTSGKPDMGGVSDVMFHAVATRIVNTAGRPGDDAPAEYIAVWSEPLLKSDSLRQDLHPPDQDGAPVQTPRVAVHEHLAKVGAELE